jgi:hypothetical protein
VLCGYEGMSAVWADAAALNGRRVGWTQDVIDLPDSPPSVTTYAVFPMNSSEVGEFRPSTMTVKVPSRLTFTRAPVFGNSPVADPGRSPHPNYILATHMASGT